MNTIWLGSLLALLAGVLTIVGNVYAKEWATRPGMLLFVLAVLFYLAGSVVFPFSLRFGSLVVLNSLASLATIVITLAIGLLYYREQITTLQTTGLLFAIVAIVLLVWPQ